MKTRTLIFTTASFTVSLLSTTFLIAAVPHPHSSGEGKSNNKPAPQRSMQQQPSTDFLTLNSPSVLNSIESHLFSAPVQRHINKLFQSRIQYESEQHTYPSLLYTFDGFWNSWKKNIENKLLFAGDDMERNRTLVSYTDRGKRNPDQAIIVSGFEYGLANMAAYLSQVMVDGIYADKCSTLSSTTEAGCETLTEEERWDVPMKDWQRVQEYFSGGWDYRQQLVEYVDGGMNRMEYLEGEKVDYEFIQSVSGVFRIGCHNVDSMGESNGCPSSSSSSSGVLENMSQRRTAFSTVLSVLRIPRLREVEVVQTTLEYLKGRKEGFEENLLLYKSGDQFYRSQRYLFDDMVSAIIAFSMPQNVTHPYSDNSTIYFESPDHSPFYMGDPYMRYGHKYGLGNIALFFANGLHLSIEKDDACDEPNENEVNGKIPISNSCGQLGFSYQDMVCPNGERNMSCTVDEDMELTAVTFSRLVGSPPPLMCAPTSKVPFTGFWNADLIREEKNDAYANENGRVDVSGCCWWGRGVLQTKGVCGFGRLNYYLGARAARMGRPSLFPGVDFCLNPEAICGSQYNNQLIWMTGLFTWIDRVQSYDEGGFNYMEELLHFADSGFKDEEFIKAVGKIVKLGCHNPPCQNAGCLSSSTCAGTSSGDEEDIGNLVTKVFRTFMELTLWDFPNSPGGSNMPSPSPTQCKLNCTDEPTMSPFDPTLAPTVSPFVDPTSIPSAAPSSEFVQRKEYFALVKMILEDKREQVENEVFVTPAPAVFTFDGFLQALEDVCTAEYDGLSFYLGQDSTSNLGHGIANIALFLAHASTRGLRLNTCEETTDINNKEILCPASLATMECTVLVDARTRRGILLNQSPCDIGRFNHIFGIPAHENGRKSSRYYVDFCTKPEVICYNSTVDASGSIQSAGAIKYLIGLVEWIDRVQSYSWGYWGYTERLKMFVDGGMNDYSFIDEFSDIVLNSSDDAELRKTTFKSLLRILFSELHSNPPMSTIDGITTVPPYNLETFSPIDTFPVYSPGENNPYFLYTQPPTIGLITAEPFAPQPAPGPHQGGSGLPGQALPANTRVDLSSSSVVVPWVTTMSYIFLLKKVMFSFNIVD
eukprot:CCRYP_001289-RA/>CCRYP_001289-RA protein AED:0.06 eAED:0.06 QI:88/1/1/1/1/1/6/58/1097